MLTENICKFVPLEPPSDKIRTINFVIETEEQKREKNRLDAFFTVHYVLSGTGKLHKAAYEYDLTEGSVFFTFPSESYAISSGRDFKYMYISYIGLRVSRLHRKIGIDFKNCVFYDCEELRETLRYFFDIAQNSNLAEISESALLYIYAVFEKNKNSDIYVPGADDTVMKIKKYINDSFGDSELSLKKISDSLSYNRNYVSTVFKKKTGVTVSKYISTIRIQNACTLMKNGITCVKDISLMCGITDALYFSKLFKAHMGMSPKKFMAEYAHEVKK